MFEGLFSPWHLLIIGAALFIVLGPEKLMRRWRDVGSTVRHLVDDESDEADPETAASPAASEPARPSLAYRLGSRLPRRRRP